MATDQYIQTKKLDQEKKIADAKLNEDKRHNTKTERTADRKLAVDLFTGATKNLTSAINDYEWYNKFKQWANNTAALGTINRVGAYYDVSPTLVLNNQPSFRSDPGLMSIRYIPGPGLATTKDSPVNRFGSALYTLIYSRINRISGFDSASLMSYILAVDSAIGLLAYLQRIYGLISNYDINNLYFPASIVKSQGVNYQSLMGRKLEFNSFIQEFTALLATLPIPKDLSYTLRHVWMNSFIFKDSDSAKSQMYMYTPLGFYKYMGSTAGKLDLVYFTNEVFTDGSLMTFDQLKTKSFDLLSALINDSGIQNIASTITKAFQPDELYSFTSLGLDYETPVICSDEVLGQIMNIDLLYSPYGKETLRAEITEKRDDTNQLYYIEYRPLISINPATNPDSPSIYYDGESEYTYNKCKINFYGLKDNQNPTPEAVLINTRGKMLWDQNTSSGTNLIGLVPTSFGSEIYLDAIIYQNLYTSTGEFFKQESLSINRFEFIEWAKTDAASLATTLDKLTALSHFDWHPCRSVYLLSGDLTMNSYPLDFFDWDSYGFMTKDQLTAIHTAALYSMWSIPALRSSFDSSSGTSNVPRTSNNKKDAGKKNSNKKSPKDSKATKKDNSNKEDKSTK
nr:putative capsid [Marmot picobirnavirus]